MATILLTWELGGGLGHLYPLRLLGAELVRRGHRVVAALREMEQAEAIFANSGIGYLPAPIKRRPAANYIDSPVTYAQILHNIGFGDATELRGLVDAWETLFQQVNPDVVVLDHSPTALLALRGSDIPTVLMGIGFYCPPDRYPLVTVRTWQAQDEVVPCDDEDRLLSGTNHLLATTGRPPLPYLARLFHDVSENLFLTFTELDHFGPRAVPYWGTLSSGSGLHPRWPGGRGPRVFAYLKQYSGLEACLKVLRRYEWPTLAVCPGLPDEVLEQLRGDTLRIVNHAVDLDAAAQECDLGITNASHGVTASLLLGGKPLVQLPLVVEQYLIAERVARMGAGLWAPSGDAAAFEQALRAVAGQPVYAQSARDFAASYAWHDAREVLLTVAERVEERAASPSQRRS